MKKEEIKAFVREILDEILGGIVQKAAEAGAKSVIAALEKERQKGVAEFQDKRFRNAKLLLQHYREFKAHAAEAIYNAEQAKDTIDFLDMMWDPLNRSDQVVESIKKSAVRTKIMVTHVRTMLRLYEKIAQSSSNPIDLRRYEVLYDRYIAPDELSVEDIAAKHHVDVRTVYSDLKDATQRMAKMLFGVDFLLSAEQLPQDEDAP